MAALSLAASQKDLVIGKLGNLVIGKLKFLAASDFQLLNYQISQLLNLTAACLLSAPHPNRCVRAQWPTACRRTTSESRRYARS